MLKFTLALSFLFGYPTKLNQTEFLAFLWTNGCYTAATVGGAIWLCGRVNLVT